MMIKHWKSIAQAGLKLLGSWL